MLLSPLVYVFPLIKQQEYSENSFFFALPHYNTTVFIDCSWWLDTFFRKPAEFVCTLRLIEIVFRTGQNGLFTVAAFFPCHEKRSSYLRCLASVCHTIPVYFTSSCPTLLPPLYIWYT